MMVKIRIYCNNIVSAAPLAILEQNTTIIQWRATATSTTAAAAAAKSTTTIITN